MHWHDLQQSLVWDMGSADAIDPLAVAITNGIKSITRRATPIENLIGFLKRSKSIIESLWSLG